MPYLTTKYTNLPEIAGKEREMTPFDGVLFGAPFSIRRALRYTTFEVLHYYHLRFRENSLMGYRKFNEHVEQDRQSL
jgi:hypothetical protein